MLLILRQIRVEQINWTAAHVHAPGLESDLPVDHAHRTDQRLAMRVEHRLDGKIFWIEQRIIIDLPVIVTDRLLKIAFAIKNTDANKTEPEITRRFCMVTRQDS